MAGMACHNCSVKRLPRWIRTRLPRDRAKRTLILAIVTSALFHLLFFLPFMTIPGFLQSPTYVKRGEPLLVDIAPERPDEKAPRGNPSQPVAPPESREQPSPPAAKAPAPRAPEAPRAPAPRPTPPSPPRVAAVRAPRAARAGAVGEDDGAQPGRARTPAIASGAQRVRDGPEPVAAGRGRPAADQHLAPAGRGRRGPGRRAWRRRRTTDPARHAGAEVPGLLQQGPRADQGELGVPAPGGRAGHRGPAGRRVPHLPGPPAPVPRGAGL